MMGVKDNVCLVALLFVGVALGQSKSNARLSMLERQSLGDYSLARCSDGSAAAYYTDRDGPRNKVMLYLGDSTLDGQSLAPCTSVDECVEICGRNPQSCRTPREDTIVQRDGIWSRDPVNNPFADYFKIYLPSCTLDDYSGSRGPLRSSSGSKIFFHGRHIFSSLLRDLVANFGIDQADTIVLVGSGSGARGVGHTCDYLSEAIATVNKNTVVKCVLDGPDMTPYWLHDDQAEERCVKNKEFGIVEETTKDLWGRTDDESCVRSTEDQVNSTVLAETCGMFSRYWRHVTTPMFVISSQWDVEAFNRLTCHVSTSDPDFGAYSTAWRQGVLNLAEAMSIDQPDNGWFIPNCDDGPLFLDAPFVQKRRNVKIPLFVSGESKNVLQVLNNWLTKGTADDDYQAIDPFGLSNPACSSVIGVEKSQPLIKGEQTRSRFVPLDPLEDVPQPKGFPDGPPPRPTDDIFGVDPVFSSDSRSDGRGFDGQDDQPELLPHRVNNGAVLTGSDLFQRHLAAQAAQAQQKRRNYYRKKLEYDAFVSFYNNRFVLPSDLLGTSTARQSDIFGQVTPNTPDFFDYDYDININGNNNNNNHNHNHNNDNSFGPGGAPLPIGILPEQAVALANSRSRKSRLWRKVYYLQYLRELYRRTYTDYYQDYYYGISGSSQFSRLVKQEDQPVQSQQE